MITKHMRPVTNMKVVATWIWTRGRKILVLLMLAILVILLAHMTPPVIIHTQHIRLTPSDQNYRPNAYGE
jgi:hypothetical protein